MNQSIFLLGCVTMAIGFILALAVHTLFFALVFIGLCMCGYVIRKLNKDE